MWTQLIFQIELRGHLRRQEACPRVSPDFVKQHLLLQSGRLLPTLEPFPAEVAQLTVGATYVSAAVDQFLAGIAARLLFAEGRFSRIFLFVDVAVVYARVGLCHRMHHYFLHR